jgi:epoxyqueuosine reductase
VRDSQSGTASVVRPYDEGSTVAGPASKQRRVVVSSDAGEQIVEKVLKLGASAAGIASLELLKQSPSHLMLARFGTKLDGEYSYESITDFGEIAWPAAAKSMLVIAVAHPRDRPELDWSSASGDTPGNELLMRVGKEVAGWAETALGIGARAMTYWVEEGGLYLKDAAVLAGLGCVGRNNILVTPEWGPRIRLRAVLLNAQLTPTGPIEFDPCHGCDERCRTACPQGAFGRVVVAAADAGIDALPGRDGTFSRARCFVQMGRDHDDSGVEVADDFLSEMAADGTPAEGPAADRTAADRDSGGRTFIKWCRRCELACPVGG